jgi:hypothetical protein
LYPFSVNDTQQFAILLDEVGTPRLKRGAQVNGIEQLQLRVSRP